MSVDSPEDLEGLRRAGAAVAATLRAVRRLVRPGVTTAELDAAAAAELRRHGARSAPALVYDFPGAICISVGDEAVHGIPGARRLRAGDLVTLDVTAERDGFFADAAVTVVVGPGNPRGRRMAVAAQAALKRGMEVARAGMPVSAIGEAVEREVTRRGFTVLGELAGHGIGRTIHEDPEVLNVAGGSDEPLTDGLVITIEPIIADGDRLCVERGDGWTVATLGGSPAAHAEHTLVVRDGAPPLVLTA
ncbi:MAG TPA: type I methionyl aminopeptidase [Capillimicrobium sp.]|nr:type I methionyl aminopeptidase [Capillimicrobium sp.]